MSASGSKRMTPLRVGIVTMPHWRSTGKATSHIMETYVSWFLTRDVEVVAIPYDTPRPEWYFGRIDGLVIPGGGAKKNLVLYQTCLTFIKYSLELWKTRKQAFPIWGTCLGFEIIVSILGHIFPLQEFNALRYMAPLNWTSDSSKSRMLTSEGFTAAYRRQLTSAALVEFNHSHGISPQKFRANIVLHRVFSVIATARDRDGKTFVAAIEGRSGLPIYGVQGHPERQPVTNAPFLDFFIGDLQRARGGRRNKLLDLVGERPKYTRGKCSQYPEHREMECFFFADGADGGALGEGKIAKFIRTMIEDSKGSKEVKEE